MSLTIPPIKDSNLRKFCQEHPLDIPLATVYQYARKCYPTAVNMGFSLSESDYGDSDDSYVVLEIETTLTPEEALDVRHQLYQAIRQLPESKYISIYHRFID